MNSPNNQPAHRLNRAALDQGSQSNGAPEYARRRSHGELLPTKRIVEPPTHPVVIASPGLATASPQCRPFSRSGVKHDLHHSFADVAAKTEHGTCVVGGRGGGALHATPPQELPGTPTGLQSTQRGSRLRFGAQNDYLFSKAEVEHRAQHYFFGVQQCSTLKIDIALDFPAPGPTLLKPAVAREGPCLAHGTSGWSAAGSQRSRRSR